MTIPLIFLLYAVSISPRDSLLLPRACATARVYGNEIFCAPFTGTTVYRMSSNGTLNAITFTDVPTRIVDFDITPFALFINDGMQITRYFLSTMDRTVVTRASDISTFAITRSEEIVYSNKRTRTVHFLDYTGQEKNRLEDLYVRDLAIVDSLIYVLTNTGVTIYDEFGTMRAKYPHKGSFNGMHVQGGRTYLFTQGRQQLLMSTDGQIVSYGLPYKLQDISGSDSLIYVLDERGTVLHRYHSTDF
jgi:hypothetical protein